MSLRAEQEHIVESLATYICIEAKRSHCFSRDVNLDTIGQMMNASESQKEKAHLRARQILKEFI